MKNDVKVSVIIPVYNGEKYVKRCVESVLSQSNVDMEVIVIDDGSQDNTGFVLKQYDDNERVRVFTQKNKGVSEARNEGIRYSTGKYIVFVDADDILLPDTLCERIDNSEGYDLLISGFEMLYADGKQENRLPCNSSEEISMAEALRMISPLVRNKYQGYLFNKVFLREIITCNDIRFDNNIAYGEDRLFVGEYIIHCERICLNADMVYRYELNDSGAISDTCDITKNNQDKILTEFYGLEKVKNLVKQYDKRIYRAFEYFEFRQAIRFLKRTDETAIRLKKYCRKLMRKRFIVSVFYFCFCYIPRSVFR